MNDMFYIITDDGKKYIAEILHTFLYENNRYAVFSFEEDELVNINVAKILNNGELKIITDKKEKQEVFKIVKQKIVGD